MAGRPKIEDLRFSSSSIDEFFKPRSSQPVRVASSGKVRVGSLSELPQLGMSFVAHDTLVRISKQDFWRLGEDAEGHFVERLVSDDEGPVRE